MTHASIRPCRPTRPPPCWPSSTTLAFLNYHRDTLRLKAAGLDQAQLAQRTAASSLTIGGLVKHLALVEHSWFTERLRGLPDIEP